MCIFSVFPPSKNHRKIKGSFLGWGLPTVSSPTFPRLETSKTPPPPPATTKIDLEAHNARLKVEMEQRIAAAEQEIRALDGRHSVRRAGSQVVMFQVELLVATLF